MSSKGNAEDTAYNAKNICITLMVCHQPDSATVPLTSTLNNPGKSEFDDGTVYGFQFGALRQPYLNANSAFVRAEQLQ